MSYNKPEAINFFCAQNREIAFNIARIDLGWSKSLHSSKWQDDQGNLYSYIDNAREMAYSLSRDLRPYIFLFPTWDQNLRLRDLADIVRRTNVYVINVVLPNHKWLNDHDAVTARLEPPEIFYMS